MIQLLSAEQLSRATERARSGNLFVQPTSLMRQYRVTNRDNGNTYVVDFFVRRDGARFGHCTCKAGLNNKACKHLSAAGYHVMRMAARRVADRVAQIPQAA